MTRKSVTEFDRKLGQRLREARLLKGLTQQQIGEMVGVSWQQVQKYESGDNRISAERLYTLSRELGLSLAFFLEGGLEDGHPTGTLSDEALRLAGQIEALPDRLVRYGVSTLVSSIARAWSRRDSA